MLMYINICIILTTCMHKRISAHDLSDFRVLDYRTFISYKKIILCIIITILHIMFYICRLVIVCFTRLLKDLFIKRCISDFQSP